jgi:hypothetical protein
LQKDLVIHAQALKKKLRRVQNLTKLKFDFRFVNASPGLSRNSCQTVFEPRYLYQPEKFLYRQRHLQPTADGRRHQQP